jgi:hypothetical protein
MQYVTVFDITKEPFVWWWPAIGLAILALGIVFIKYISRFPSQKNAKIIGWVMVVFAPIYTVVVFGSMYSEWTAERTAFSSRSYSVVEGIVEDFKPMPYEGHQNECFRVKNQKFCYSDYVIVGGFRQTASHGGPIREGLPVRIWYSDGEILRLEVQANSLPTTAERETYSKAEEAKMYNWIANDSTIDQMRLGFSLAALIITLCWNLDWRHYMRYWIKKGPPYSRTWELAFRTFFLLGLVGSIVELFRTISGRHRNAADYEKAALYSLIGIGLFGIYDVILRLKLRSKNRAVDNVPQSGSGS